MSEFGSGGRRGRFLCLVGLHSVQFHEEMNGSPGGRRPVRWCSRSRFAMQQISAGQMGKSITTERQQQKRSAQKEKNFRMVKS